MVSIHGAEAILRDDLILKSWKDRSKVDVSLEYPKHLGQFKVSPSCVGGLSIIEYGCGPVGGVLPYLEKAKRRVGVDILMAEYKGAGLLKKLKGVKMVRGDMADAKWTDEFDMAFCINALDHAVDASVPEKALWAMYQALRSGGQLYLHFHCRTSEQVDFKHLYAIDENWLLNVSDVIGFKVKSMDVFPSDPLNFVNERAYKTIVAELEK